MGREAPSQLGSPESEDESRERYPVVEHRDLAGDAGPGGGERDDHGRAHRALLRRAEQSLPWAPGGNELREDRVAGAVLDGDRIVEAGPSAVAPGDAADDVLHATDARVGDDGVRVRRRLVNVIRVGQ